MKTPAWLKSIGDFFKRLFSGWGKPPPGPNPPPIMPETPYEFEVIFEGPPEMYKIVGMFCNAGSLVFTLSNVYRSPNRSAILEIPNCTDPKPVSAATRYATVSHEETIGKPIVHEGTLYFPVEHGPNILKMLDGRVTPAGKSAGRWSTMGMVYNGRPLIAFNNNYNSNRQFADFPIFVDARDGGRIFTLPVKAMPRQEFTHGGKRYVISNFGNNCVMGLDPESGSYYGDYACAASFEGSLFLGGGAAFEQTGSPGLANGMIYKVGADGKVENFFDTKSSLVCDMLVAGGSLFVAVSDPDKIYRIPFLTQTPVEILSRPGETSNDKQRSFGACLAANLTHVFAGFSTKTRAHVLRARL